MKNSIFGAAVASSMLAMPALAEGPHMTVYNGSYEDARFSVESAIVNRGLVIDYVSRVGEMLMRTSEDVGGNEHLFSEAEIFIFCSAKISREVMEMDPMNIAHCPYGIFVMERRGKVSIGYRDYPEGPMDIVEDMLAEIVAEAADF